MPTTSVVGSSLTRCVFQDLYTAPNLQIGPERGGVEKRKSAVVFPRRFSKQIGYSTVGETRTRLRWKMMPITNPISAGSSQPRFLSNKGRYLAAKLTRVSMWKAV